MSCYTTKRAIKFVLVVAASICSVEAFSSRANRRNKNRIKASDGPLSYEESLMERGYKYIIGSDEVGRGSIAGPVLVASCSINIQRSRELSIPLIAGVGDSKTLTEKERMEIYQQIVMSDPAASIYKFNCVERSPQQIDNSNILKATMEGFQESIQNLVLGENMPLDRTYSIVDGKSTPKLVNGPTPIPCRPMVNADSKVYTVSMASIIAKVTRDKIMRTQAHEMYPEYDFHINKGYSTREHIEKIHKYGPCPLHRMSFKALKHRS